MSNNIFEDIKQIYSVINESSHLETDMEKRRKNNEEAIEDMKKTKAHKDMTRAARKAMGVDEAANAKPDYLDFDKDGNKKESMKKALKDKEDVKEGKKANDGNLANNYPPYDKITRGDVIAGRLGKDEMGGKKKDKNVEEGFSDWRQDLSEVMDTLNSETNDKEIKEKKVKNKIKINPTLGESVEEMGGVLLEMVEMDELEGLVESVYDELLYDGYDEDDIENAIEYALTEAKVTMGHDTPVEKKRSGLLAAAKEKLAGAKASAKAAVARGARKVAKKALGVARKMEGGKEAPKTAERKPSTYRGAGAGTKERVSSGSYTPPTKKKAEKPSDPWEGSATTPPKAKAKKSAAPKAKATAAPKRKRKSKLDDLLASVRSESVVRDRAKNAVGDDRLDVEQEKTNTSMNKLRQQNKRFDRALASDAARKVERDVKKSSSYGPQHPKPGTVTGRRIEDPKPTGSKSSGYRVEEIEIDEDAGIISGLAGLALGAKGASYAAKHTKRMRDYPKNFVKGIVDPRTYVSKKKNDQKEEFQIDEKALSKAQQRFMGMVYAAKKGETPASPEVAKAASGMSEKEAKKFAKTKHKGLPEKVEEQQVDPKTQQVQRQQLALDRKKLALKTQMASKKQETPSTDMIASEEFVTELNRAEKETGINTKTGRPTQKGGAKDDKAFTIVKQSIRKMEGTPAGQRKKEKGKKPPVAGQYGAPKSPAQKVAQRRAAAKRSQDNMSSRFD